MNDGPFRHVGKQVLRGSEHYADAASYEAAALIVDALNFYERFKHGVSASKPKRGGGAGV